jgi:ArsR family metal-binding transcriptional regulator
MLIEDYDIEFGTPDCQHPSCDELFAKVAVKADITELLPYVNAVIRKGEFTTDVPVLVWVHGGHKYALRPHEVAVSSLDGREKGLEEVRRTIEWLNDIWDRRDELTPDHSAREKPRILDVYKLLPRTNCKECGLPSCMGFAGELVAGNKSLEDCAPLLEEMNDEARRKLLEMGL